MTLQHNDGLLPESYMQMHEVSYRQAQLMLEEDVEDIKNILQQYGKLSLGVLGSFSIGEEGQMIFHPGNRSVQCRLVWLACFPFPGSRSTRDGTRRSGSSCIPKREEDALYIPISRKAYPYSDGFGCCSGIVPVGFYSG